MTACLTLANGHHSTRAPLEFGYYMIGRHRDCQIRPRSHSVSRRHCLLQHDPTHLRVYDLGSTNTTTVNDKPLEPNEWRELADGDEIRCGKVLFRVGFHVDNAEQDLTPPESGTASDPHGGASVGGEPWQDFDIASFLEEEDAKERNRSTSRPSQFDGSANDASDSAHVLDEDPDANAEHASPSAIHGATSIDVTGDGTTTVTAARSERLSRIRSRLEKQRSKDSRKKQQFRKAARAETSDDDSSPWVTYAAAVLMCLACISAVYLGYQSFAGSQPRILDGID